MQMRRLSAEWALGQSFGGGDSWEASSLFSRTQRRAGRLRLSPGAPETPAGRRDGRGRGGTLHHHSPTFLPREPGPGRFLAGPSRLKHRAPCSLTSEFLLRGFCPEAPLLRLQACEGCLWDARAGLEKGHQGSRCFWKSFGLCRVPVLRVHVSSFCSQGGHSGLKGRWEPLSVS